MKGQITPQIKRLLVGHSKVFLGTGQDLCICVERLEARPTVSFTKRDAASTFDLGFGEEGRHNTPFSGVNTTTFENRLNGLEYENKQLKLRMNALMKAMEDNVPRADPSAAKFSGADGGVPAKSAATFGGKDGRPNGRL